MLVKISLERHTSATLNIKCMLADFWKCLRPSLTLLIYITSLKTILKTGCKTTPILCNEQKSHFAMFPEWILTRFFPPWSPLNSITVYSSSSYLPRHRERAKHRSPQWISRHALRAKEAVLSAPLLPRKPNYNSDTVCGEGQEWRMAKSLANPARGNLLLWKRKASSPRGSRPHNQAVSLTWYEQFSWCTISVHPRAQTPKQDGSARLQRPSAEHPLAARTPWAGRGSPQIKMDAVSLSNLRSGTACAGKRAGSRAALLGNQQRGSQTWS